jgi:hypothetical protein
VAGLMTLVGLTVIHYLKLFKIVHVLDEIHRAVAWGTIQLLNDLGGGEKSTPLQMPRQSEAQFVL